LRKKFKFLFQIKLIEGKNTEVDPDGMRMATSSARKSKKPGYTLCYKLLAEIFSLQTLASSRGQGIGKKTTGDPRPVLDGDKISNLKSKKTFILLLLKVLLT
jgi:hypothetical protein